MQSACAYVGMINDLGRAQAFVKGDELEKERVLDGMIAQFPMDALKPGHLFG